MTKRTHFRFMPAMILVVLIVVGAVQAKYGGGSGTESDPYLIYTAEQMNTIGLNSGDWASHFKLMADVNLAAYTGTQFNIIGYYHYFTDNYPFTGVFDGNSHTISNLTYICGCNGIGLFGYVKGESAEIKDLGLIDSSIDFGVYNGGGSLVGVLEKATINNCYAEFGTVYGYLYAGGLVGDNLGSIVNCYTVGVNVSGLDLVGALAGYSSGGQITNCYATGSVFSRDDGGGLVGGNSGMISNCYATGSVFSGDDGGGLVGGNGNSGTISNCYATGSVFSGDDGGGLVGRNSGTISNCYAVGSVSGNEYVGGLVGLSYGTVTGSFWDVNTSGLETSAGGEGKTTEQMQTESTFVDAGWDFDTPVWTICEGVDYPRLWWEYETPVLHSEPETTMGYSNTISWEPTDEGYEYYAECSRDANFSDIFDSSGWVADTNYVFSGLEVGETYWYRVLAVTECGYETEWSNVESSMQISLADAVSVVLDVDSLKNGNMADALLSKIDAALAMLDAGKYRAGLNKLENDILAKTDGCANGGEPDKNDWIITCEEQEQIYPLIIETIEYVESLMD